MDLDKIKESWSKHEVENSTISKKEIYNMAHSKSSSVVKWIFLIGLIEFIFWISINSIVSKMEVMHIYEDLNLVELLNAVYYVNLVIVVIFLYYFYKNYSAISTIDNTKSLMNKILKTRKTVKYYVNYNVIGTLILMLIFNIVIINTPNGIETMLSADQLNLDKSQLLSVYIISQAVSLAIVIILLFAFYYLLYGRLLKKLKRNHKELDKIEHLN